MNRREFIKGSLAAGMGASALGCALRRGLEDPLVGKAWSGWTTGHFQIHAIYTGVAESLFLIFPDGTTMLLDCGDHPACMRGKLAVPVLPDQSRHAGEWISRYVLKVNPHGKDVDYLLLTHYHSDHSGHRKFHAGIASNGKYVLSGIGQAMEFLSFRRAIDRAWPTFDDPLLTASKPLSPEQGYRFRFVVSPVNSYGVKGRPIRSEWTAIERIDFK